MYNVVCHVISCFLCNEILLTVKLPIAVILWCKTGVYLIFSIWHVVQADILVRDGSHGSLLTPLLLIPLRNPTTGSLFLPAVILVFAQIMCNLGLEGIKAHVVTSHHFIVITALPVSEPTCHHHHMKGGGPVSMTWCLCDIKPLRNPPS